MVFRPRDLADRMAGRRKPDDGYLRETFTLPRDKARTKARDFLTRYPKAAYMSGVESWRELPGWRYRVHDAAAAQRRLKHDPENACSRPMGGHPVFPRDKREAFARRSCSNKKVSLWATAVAMAVSQPFKIVNFFR